MANVCCNPLNKLRYKKVKVRSVLPWMCKKAPTFILNHKICDSCRKKLAVSFQNLVMKTLLIIKIEYVNQS